MSAGDWIKMRTNLWDDPRVSRLCDMTNQSEAAVIGALYWLWSSADEHTEDGLMPGLSLTAIDRKTRVPGIGGALAEINWIEETPDGVRIVRFEEHNGTSAKRRASEARRKMSARDADKSQTKPGEDAHLEGEGEGEVEGEVNHSVGESIPRNLETTPAERICARLRNVGVRYVNPSHPKLLALIQAGISEGELADLASEPASRGKGFAWILAAAEGRRKDASTVIPSLTVVPAADKPPEVCAHCGKVASKRIGLLWFCTEHDQYSVQEVG